jgi:hypothetical protein
MVVSEMPRYERRFSAAFSDKNAAEYEHIKKTMEDQNISFTTWCVQRVRSELRNERVVEQRIEKVIEVVEPKKLKLDPSMIGDDF